MSEANQLSEGSFFRKEKNDPLYYPPPKKEAAGLAWEGMARMIYVRGADSARHIHG